MNRLLIVDDDHGLVNLLKRFLEGEGFQVDAAYDHASGLSAALSGEHELIILDVMLPGGSGFELLKALRQRVGRSGAPADRARRSRRSHSGSGDRRRRLPGQALRSARTGGENSCNLSPHPRTLPAGARPEHDEVLTVGDISMSLGTRTVTCSGKPVDLTSVEFNVLELLLRHAGSVVTREQIAEVALGRPLNAFDRSVDVHVSRLRKKLGVLHGGDDLIRPIRGIGYFLAAETPEKSKV